MTNSKGRRPGPRPGRLAGAANEHRRQAGVDATKIARRHQGGRGSRRATSRARRGQRAPATTPRTSLRCSTARRTPTARRRSGGHPAALRRQSERPLHARRRERGRRRLGRHGGLPFDYTSPSPIQRQEPATEKGNWLVGYKPRPMGRGRWMGGPAPTPDRPRRQEADTSLGETRGLKSLNRRRQVRRRSRRRRYWRRRRSRPRAPPNRPRRGPIRAAVAAAPAGSNRQLHLFKEQLHRRAPGRRR